MSHEGSTYLLSLYTKLKTMQEMANIMPIVASNEQTTVNARWTVTVTGIGTPS